MPTVREIREVSLSVITKNLVLKDQHHLGKKRFQKHIYKNLFSYFYVRNHQLILFFFG